MWGTWEVRRAGFAANALIKAFFCAVLLCLVAGVPAAPTPRIASTINFIDTASTFPVSLPFKFGIDQAVRFSVKIHRHRAYYLDLGILFDNQSERNVARHLIGGAPNICKALKDCGEETSFHVKITSEGNVVLQQDKEPYGAYSFDGKAFFRNILIVPLRPGLYEFEISIEKFGAPLMDARVNIILGTYGNANDLGR